MAKAPRKKAQQTRGTVRQQRLNLMWDGDEPAPDETMSETLDDDAQVGDVDPEPADAETREPEAETALEQHAAKSGDEAEDAAPDQPGQPSRDDEPASDGKRQQEQQREKRESAETRIIELGPVDMSVGQVLQEARGAANVTIAQVAQETKIRKQLIETIENDQLDALPSPFYARSYITKLCREYGIDDAPVLEQYTKTTGHAPPGQAASLVVTAEQTEAATKVKWGLEPSKDGGGWAWTRLLRTRYIVGAIIVMLALLIAAAVFRQRARTRAAQQSVQPPPATDGTEARDIGLDEFIITRPLPLKELPVPKN